MKLYLPVIHSGGTHRDCLQEDYHKAQQSLYAALQDFDRIEFNQRDYFVNGSWDNALQTRTEIRECLLKALFYLESHTEHTQQTLA